MRYHCKVQGNVFALVQIFNAIPSPFFSAPAELRIFNPNHWSLSYINPSLKPLEWSCSIHPRRPTGSDSLEERFRKAGLGWVGVFNVAPTFACTFITILFLVTLGQSPKFTVFLYFAKMKTKISTRNRDERSFFWQKCDLEANHKTSCRTFSLAVFSEFRLSRR